MTAGLDHRIAVGRDFDMMQGLINVGTGLGFVLAWVTGQPILLTLVAGVGAAVATDFYRKRYGTMRAPMRRNVGVLAAAIVFAVVAFVAILADRFEPGPILWTSLASAPALAFACLMGLRHAGVTAAHWAVIGLLAASSLLPLVGGDLGPWACMLPVGLALIAVGVIDHRRLVAAFGEGVAE